MNFNFKSGKNKITINGEDYVGGNLTIKGDKVIIDGKVVKENLIGDVTLVVTGDVETVSTNSGSVHIINGEVKTASTMSGDLICGNILGNAKTMSGDITCNKIYGKAETMSGDIYKGE